MKQEPDLQKFIKPVLCKQMHACVFIHEYTVRYTTAYIIPIQCIQTIYTVQLYVQLTQEWSYKQIAQNFMQISDFKNFINVKAFMLM